MEIYDRNTDMYILNTSLIANRNFNKHSNTGYCPVDFLVPLHLIPHVVDYHLHSRRGLDGQSLHRRKFLAFKLVTSFKTPMGLLPMKL